MSFVTASRQKNTTILGWSELVAATMESRRLTKTTNLSERCLSIATGRVGGSYLAQLDEQLFAKATKHQIEMFWVQQGRAGTSTEGRLRVYGNVVVRQCGDGSTQYTIPTGMPGLFANRWLPITYARLRSQSKYTRYVDAHGSGDMWQEGVGAVYEHAGPDFLNATAADANAAIGGCDWASDAWKDAARDLLDRLVVELSSFPHVRLRYEYHTLTQDCSMNPEMVDIYQCDTFGLRRLEASLHFPYFLTASLHLPLPSDGGVSMARAAVFPRPSGLSWMPEVLFGMFTKSLRYPLTDELTKQSCWVSPENVVRMAVELAAATVVIPA